MRDSHGLEQGNESLILSTIVSEHGDNGCVKVFFHQTFKLGKKFGDIRFIFYGIQPNIF